MGEILLVIMMSAIFVFGYFMIDRFGKIMDKTFAESQNPQGQDKEILVTDIGRRSTDDVLNEVRTILDRLPDSNEYQIIFHHVQDSSVIKYLEESGYKIKYTFRQ